MECWTQHVTHGSGYQRTSTTSACSPYVWSSAALAQHSCTKHRVSIVSIHRVVVRRSIARADCLQQQHVEQARHPTFGLSQLCWFECREFQHRAPSPSNQRTPTQPVLEPRKREDPPGAAVHHCPLPTRGEPRFETTVAVAYFQRGRSTSADLLLPLTD